MATLTQPKVEQKTLVRYRVETGLGILELDDPPANTYTYDMMRQLDEAILQARFDDNVHVIVLRGHGDKFFSAGANIAYLNRSEEHTSELQSRLHLVCRLLLEKKKTKTIDSFN